MDRTGSFPFQRPQTIDCAWRCHGPRIANIAYPNISVERTDPECCWVFVKHQVVMIAEEIGTYLGQRVGAHVGKLIGPRRLFPSYRKSRHSHLQSANTTARFIDLES